MTVNYSHKDLLASTAVFAEMANKNVDLKQILTEFILSTYSLENTFSQTANDVVKALCDHFEFDIPLAVSKTLLKKLRNDGVLTLDEGKFSISAEERKKWENFIEKVESKESEQGIITGELIDYVERQRGPLDDEGKTELLKCFSSYLFDESFEDGYSDLVSAFIIKKSKEGELTKELNLIREGITILRGIKYNPEINEVQSWRKQLTIYLDTEHLFSAAGYNGEVYKKLIDDLLTLVREINIEHQKKNSERAIQFKFLEETETEVKGFFYAAKKIIAGENNRGHSSVAMDSILKGAKTTSDVIRKETDFFNALGAVGIIKEQPIELYENHRLNVEDSSIYEKYEKDCGEDEISAILKSFTAVNIKRQGNNSNSFENIGYIIMTGSKIKLYISSDIDTKISDGDFSFATHIYYVTQRLWFRLNRGLGFNSQLPSSLDVVAKAQMLLSNHLNSSVRERYNKLEQDVESGSRTLESVQDYYINLRSNVVKPEELIPENVEERVKFLYDEDDIESFQEEQSILRQKAEAFDKLKKAEADKEERELLEARASELDECRELRDAVPGRAKTYGVIAFLILVVLIALITWGVISVVSDNDTPLGIIGLAIGIGGILISLISRKKIQKFINKQANKDFIEYMKTHSIDESEL